MLLHGIIAAIITGIFGIPGAIMSTTFFYSREEGQQEGEDRISSLNNISTASKLREKYTKFLPWRWEKGHQEEFYVPLGIAGVTLLARTFIMLLYIDL